MDEDDEDCLMCKVLKKGWCKSEFERFDVCYEAAKSSSQGEAECMPLFKTFRECFQRRALADKLMRTT